MQKRIRYKSFHLKKHLRLAVASAALLLTISNAFPIYAADIGEPPEASTPSQDDAVISRGAPTEDENTVSSGDILPSPGDTAEQEPPDDGTEKSDGGTGEFTAHIEYSPQGYLAVGTFTLTPDTSLIQPLYSLDGDAWKACQKSWTLQELGYKAEEDLKLQSINCLYGSHEPLADYLAGKLDRFYLKLQITLENGITYETQAAVIDRGEPQPIPKGYSATASFVSDMLIRQWRPFKCYGQYQMTISATAAEEDVSALLPDTLPIDIQIYAGIDFVANAVVDCPVTWKALSLPQLSPGDSIVIPDAAEEIIVPAGTLLNTPIGALRLDEPLGFASNKDEIRLVLNVAADDAAPTGALICNTDGLYTSFRLKPTGATSIQVYALAEGASKWTEIPGLAPKDVNAPASTANSIYTLVIKNDQEPYRSYLAAYYAGEKPTPFLIGLKIKGGIYDGQELVLAWPDTYEIPTVLPKMGGSQGNEGNAGSDNECDSTPEGQRPGLPQDTENPQHGTDAVSQDADHSQETGRGQDAQDLSPARTQETGNPQHGTDTVPQDADHSQETGRGQDAQDLSPARTQEAGNPQHGTDAVPQDAQPSQETGNGQDAQDLGPARTQDAGNPQHKTDAILQETGNPQRGTDAVPQETEPSQEAGDGQDARHSGILAGTPFPAGRKAAGEHRLPRFLFPAAVTSIGVCIAASASKATATGISNKIKKILYRLLHPNKT